MFFFSYLNVVAAINTDSIESNGIIIALKHMRFYAQK